MKEKIMGKFFGLKLPGCAFAALLSALLAAGCMPPMMPDYDASAGQSRQAVIRIGDAAPARSLVPTDAPVFTKYELVFSAEGKADVYRSLETSRDRSAITGGGYAVDLEEAAWTVTVSAFVQGTGSAFLEAARGSSSFTVSAATRNPSVNITLTPLPMDGETRGILAWNLNLSGVSGSVSVTGTITKVVNGIPELGTYLPAGMSGSKELDSGYYLLQFTLYKEGKSAGVYRAVHIYPGLTTKAEGADFTFTNDDFAEQKYLAGTVEITGVPGDRTVEWVKVQPYQDSDFAIPLPDAASSSIPQPDAVATVAADNSWFLSIPGNVSDVYFKVRMKLADSDDVYNLIGGKETAVPPTGRKDITLSAVWSEIEYTVSFNAGNGSGTPPASRPVISGGTIYLPEQGSMTPPAGRNFNGWRINGQNYSPKASFIVTGNIVCTALWGINGPLTPTPVPEEKPKILWSSGDPTGYTYLVYAGKIRDVYTSTISTKNYSGTPVNQTWELSTTASGSDTDSVTVAISETVGVSLTVGLKASVEASGPGVKAGFEASMSETISATGSYSRTDTTETTRGWSTTEATTVQFNVNDLTGRYRQAIYANVCDVYFYFKTSPDRQNLLSWDTIVCARPGDGVFSNVEYSADGDWTCEDPATKIDFQAYFWRTFAKPSLTAITTDWKTVRSGEVRVWSNDEGWFTNRSWALGRGWYDDGDKPYDSVSFNSFTDTDSGTAINLNDLRNAGYTRVRFNISLNVKEDDDGLQWVGIFKSTTQNDDQRVAEYKWDHGGNGVSSYWVETANIDASIASFTDQFVVRYKATGKDDDFWRNKDLKIQLVFSQ
jgi:hypothetical protein